MIRMGEHYSSKNIILSIIDFLNGILADQHILFPQVRIDCLLSAIFRETNRKPMITVFGD